VPIIESFVFCVGTVQFLVFSLNFHCSVLVFFRFFSVYFGFFLAFLSILSLSLPWEREPKRFSRNWERILTFIHVPNSLFAGSIGQRLPDTAGFIAGHFRSRQPNRALFAFSEVVLRFFESTDAIDPSVFLIPVSASAQSLNSIVILITQVLVMVKIPSSLRIRFFALTQSPSMVRNLRCSDHASGRIEQICPVQLPSELARESQMACHGIIRCMVCTIGCSPTMKKEALRSLSLATI
jgi:hypothetical protein